MHPSPERIEGEVATPARRWQRLGCPLIIAAIALAFGWPTRHGAFLSGDDQRLVTEHFLVNHPSLAHAADLFATFHGDLYQPLPMVTFQLDFARAERTPSERFPVRALPFHVTNIALHALNAILAYLLAARLARCRRVGLLAGLMFACHPFAVEPVAWISGRMILLATTFSLATLCLCIGPAKSRVGTDAAAIVAWLAAILTKVVPTVPIAAAWCDYVQRNQISRRKIAIYLVLILLAIGGSYLALQATEEAGFLEGMQAQQVAPMPMRLLFATRYYLENYIWPSRLAAWSPPPADTTINSPPPLTAIVEITLLVTLAWVARRRLPAAYVGIVLFGILLSPLLAAGAARNFLAADRYMYLPIIGLHLAVAATAVAAIDELSLRFSRVRADLLVGLPIILVLAAWMSYSWLLTSTWRSSVSRDGRVVHVYPDSELAHAELAKAFNFEGDPDGAVRVVEMARKLWPESGPLAAAAGNAYRLKGKLEKAREELEIAVKRMPDHVLTRYRLGQVLEESGALPEAQETFVTILAKHPDHFPAHVALARLYKSQGDNSLALVEWEKALKLNPIDREAMFEVSAIFIDNGQLEAAKSVLEQLLHLYPSDVPAKVNHAATLAQLGEADRALKAYNALIADRPLSINLLMNRAALLSSLDRGAEAERDYLAVLNRRPRYLAAMTGLSLALQRQKKYLAMVDFWRMQLGITSWVLGQGDEVWAWLTWSHAMRGDSSHTTMTAGLVSPDSPHFELVMWAYVLVEIEDVGYDDLMTMLGSSDTALSRAQPRSDESRAVMLAVDELSKEVKASAVGVYLLARAALFAGNLEIARTAAEQLAESTEGEKWKRAGTDVLNYIRNMTKPDVTSQSAPR